MRYRIAYRLTRSSLIEVTLARGDRDRAPIVNLPELAPCSAVVSSVPSSIEFGLFDLPHTRRAHATELDQNKRPLTIELRPFTFRTTRREANQPIVGVELVELSVNPSVTQRAVDRFLLRDARDSRRTPWQASAIRPSTCAAVPASQSSHLALDANARTGSSLLSLRSMSFGYAFLFAPGR